ncbi:hypothetical protein TSUD_165490 [Trifolium subterraneum]|uniref:Uncharacterized protein n=1 Tax=Trifolium subterraneum TaxID=3900 RepID=A0A2Z6MB21_TRISU|nr:hypothetical protein TSUD_165490 [Trifolium subterraneum]
MEELILANCSFTGDFQLPSRPRLNLVGIDVSNNAITCQMLSNNMTSIFPKLVDLNMSENAIDDGLILYELSQMTSLDVLDLSDNHLSGEIPYNLFRNGSQMTILSLSKNNLHGLIPPMLSILSLLECLFLDGNILSGSIPSDFFNSSTIELLDISNNHFIGKIPSQMNCPSLIELSMSNNHFEGSIPSAFATLESIIYLDLSKNNLTGCIPSFVNSPISFIHLSNNNLTCFAERMFGEGSSIVTLDINNNEMRNEIHDLIHDLHHTRLSILLMKGNHFTGNIPKSVCQMIHLNLLDLSYNDFVGEMPKCLGKMPFANKDPEESRKLFDGPTVGKQANINRFGKEKAAFTSKKRLEIYTINVLIYMSGIDLSHNKLNGSIPSELGNLIRIRSLNLSNNFFIGKIPTTFSNLVQVESLDLSFNMLSGQIPPQLTGLTSLEVFSVAHNNLSGPTPERKGQFITFDQSSYEGNQFLCGPPLPKSCNAPTLLPNGLNKDDGDDHIWVDMYVFCVSFVVAYTSILLVILIVLYINPYWRQAWFYYTGLMGMNSYYFIKDNLFCLF